MKKTIFFAGILAFLVLWSKPLLATKADYHIEISAYLLEESKKTEWGKGSFSVKENRYGQGNFTFSKGLEQVSFRVGSGDLGPFTRLLSETGPKVSAEKIFLAADLYLRASPSEGGLIRLKGFLIKLTQVESKGFPLFEYSEEELDFMLPDNGTKTILLDNKQIYLDISINTKGELIYKPRITRNVTFDTEYHLHNLETKKYELESKGCVLGLTLDSPLGEATCFNQKVYKIQGGDSLLYISAYQIKNATSNGKDQIKFQLEVSHVYAINPIMDGSHPEELKSDKTTVILFNKEITAKIGEKTEIEIPQDKGSLLPFSSKETIVLRNSVKEIRE